MAYIYANVGDGVITGPSSNNYNTARNATTGTAAFGNATDDVGINVSAAGRSTLWQYHRAFFTFDVSGESGTVDSCTFEVESTTNRGGRFVAIFHDAGTVLGNDDYNNVFTSGTTMEDYSSSVTISSTGYHTFNLNSDGISALQSKIGSGDFEIGLVAYVDFLATRPLASVEETITFSDSLSSPIDKPRIEITYESGVTYNAPFLGANF